MIKNGPLRSARLIRGLHYFEAVARHKSVKHAAHELGVSQSAVSHQLRELTEALGEQLLVRSGRGIALTVTGQRLSEHLATTFSGLQSHIDGIVGGAQKSLRLAICSCFGPGWLIPRLHAFHAAHPGIDLQLRLYGQDPEQTDHVADAFITALPVSPGFVAIPILDEMLVAVQATQSAGTNIRRGLITTDIEKGRLGQDWFNYCMVSGLRLGDIHTGTWVQCTHYILALEMAKAGLGVALVPDFLAARELDAGTVCYFDRTRMEAGRRYHLCFKKSRTRDEAIGALVQWLKAESLARPAIRLVKRTNV
jgi:LysR family glycine cleavage system transcriptional activator